MLTVSPRVKGSRRVVLVAGGVALASVLTGCAQPGTQDVGDPLPGVGSAAGAPATGIDPAVLDAWRDFPVNRQPRPVVLLVAALRETGYRNDAAKLAVATGRYQLATKMPATHPATVTVKLPDGTFPLPVIGAAQAFERVRSTGKPENAPDATPAPLRITKVELGSAPFQTDRGLLTLPAWLFHAPDSMEPLAWPAVHPDSFWRFGDQSVTGDVGNGRLAADGVTLTVSLPAPNPNTCPGDPVQRYVPVAVEKDTAVAVGVRVENVTTAPGTRRDDCGYDMMLRLQDYTFKLTAPLGNRVVIGSSGGPLAVTVG